MSDQRIPNIPLEAYCILLLKEVKIQKNGNLRVDCMKVVLDANTDVELRIFTRMNYTTVDSLWRPQFNPTSFDRSFSKRAPWSGSVRNSATIGR